VTRAPGRRGLVVLVSLAVLFACRSQPPPPDPDLSGLEPRVAAALDEARQAVQAHPASAEAWGNLGALYDAHRITDPAVECYRRAHELNPGAFEWSYLLAIAREIQGGDADELIELFGRAAARSAGYAPLHVRLGDALWRRGRSDAARTELARALELAPESPMAHRRMGQVLLSLGDARAAAVHLERAVALRPEDLAAHTALAQALARLGEGERARVVRERAFGLEPAAGLEDPVYAEYVFLRDRSSSGAFARAVAAIRQGFHERAVEDLEIVLEVRPDDPSVHYWMGLACGRSGDLDRALEHLTRSVTLDPALAPAHVERGRQLLARGRPAEAVEAFERAARLRPLNAEARRALDLARAAVGP
jgi:tetratricopeptide (TPR) repeat protein